MQGKSKPKQQSSLTGYISGYGQWCYLKAKMSWASWLERKSSGLSKAKLKAVLLMILLSWVVYCFFLVISGFRAQRGADVRITPITTVIPANRSTSDAGMKILQTDYQKVRALHNYMDSLRRDVIGIRIRDSLLKARPRLMDSSMLLQNYYESNLKR